MAEASLVDWEGSAGNVLEAWTSTAWVQTTRSDFEAGVPGQVDTQSSPGDVRLARNDRIFAFQGGTAAFWGCNVTANSWTSMAVALATVGAGGALAYDGSRYIYAFRGNNSNAFWRYDIVNNSWLTMTSAPQAVGAGGALAYDGSRYIYAFRGNNTNAFWRYDTVNNSWSAMASAPANVANGGALVFVPTYVNSATLASPVLDAGVTGARWDALFWDETLPPNTDIVFEVRASDVLFAKDAANPSWILVGGTSPVSTGLPFGRYMQWRVTLTTLNTSVTPVLHEVRLYYF